MTSISKLPSLVASARKGIPVLPPIFKPNLSLTSSMCSLWKFLNAPIA